MSIASNDGTRVVCTDTSMEGIQLFADCIVENSGSEIKNVTVGSSETEEAINAIIKGDYPEVTFESTANVTIDGKVSLMTVLEKAGMTSIEMVDESKCYFYSCYGQSVTITGGAIIEAWINAENCSLPEDTGLVGSNIGIANVMLGGVAYDIPVWEQPGQGEPAEGGEDSSSDGFFNNGYPKVSQNGSVVTILSSCATPCKIYACVEGNDVSLGEMSPAEVIDPAAQ